MYILGINESHGKNWALLKDGRIISQGDTGIRTEDIDLIVFGFRGDPNPPYGVQTKAFLERYVPPVPYEMLTRTVRHILWPLLVQYHQRQLSKILKYPQEKIILLDHHTAHAYAAFYSAPKKGKHLVITNDGMGEEYCGKVFVVSDNLFHEIASTPNRFSLAYLYYYVTKYLGFVPNRDEARVMKLAGVLTRMDAYERLREILWNDGLSFAGSIPRLGYYHYIKKNLARFSKKEIASAIQTLVEELVATQVKNAIQKTGIRSIYLGGGLAANSKANQKIKQLPEVESLHICPNPGDTSTAIGASYWGYSLLRSQIKSGYKNGSASLMCDRGIYYVTMPRL